MNCCFALFVATEEVINVDDAEECVQMVIDAPSPRRNPMDMDTDHDMVPKFLEIQSDASVRALIDIVQARPSALAVTTPQPAAPPSILYVLYPLASTLEDGISTNKEAMIQAELMNPKLKDSVNSSEALKAHPQEGTIVSVGHFHSDVQLFDLSTE